MTDHLETRSFTWSTNGHIIVFVASQGYRGDDWAAYMSAFDDRSLEGDPNWKREAIEQTHFIGDKMPPSWARAIFPDFADKYTWRA